MSTTIAKILFTVPSSNKDITICSPVSTVGAVGHSMADPANGFNLCSSRPSNPRSSRAAARMSNIALAFQLLVNKEIAPLIGNDSNAISYVEFLDTLGVVKQAVTFDGVQFRMKEEETTYTELATALFLYGLSKCSPMGEFKAAFVMCTQDYLTNGSVPTALLFYLCDCFYYEFISKVVTTTANQEIPVTADLTPEMISQMCRSQRFATTTLFQDLGCPPFTFAEAPSPTVSTDPIDEKTDVARIYADACAGKYRLNYPWHPEQMSLIKPLPWLQSFIPTEDFADILTTIYNAMSNILNRLNDGAYGTEAIGDDCENILLRGKPGTGKTTIIEAVACALGVPLYSVNIECNTEEDTFEGKIIPTDNGLRLVDTPFMEWAQCGGIIVLEEINLGNPAVLMGALGQLIIKPYQMYKGGVTPVHRHPLSCLFGTMNNGTNGSKDPSQAFINRLPNVIPVRDPEKEDFFEIMRKHGHEEANIRFVYDKYTKIMRLLTREGKYADDAGMWISMRNCFQCLKLIERDRYSQKKAVLKTFIGAIGVFDEQAADEIADTIFDD